MTDNIINEQTLSIGELDKIFNRAASLKSGKTLSGTAKSKKEYMTKMLSLSKKDSGNIRQTNAQDVLSPKDIEQTWIRSGKPKDAKSVKALLKKSFSFSNSDIRKIFSSSARSSNPAVNDMVSYVKNNSLEKEVLSMLDQMGIKKSLSSRIMGESVFEADEMIADRDIKDIIDKLVNVHGTPDDIESQDDAEVEDFNQNERVTTTAESVILWSNIICNYPHEEKMMAVNEAINFVSNAYGINKWLYINKKVISLLESREYKLNESLNDGRVMDEKLFRFCQELLKECDLTWNDFLTRPVKVAGYFKFKPVIFQRKSLLEDALGRKKL